MADDTTTDADEADASAATAGENAPAEKKDGVPPEVRRALTKANKEAETLRLKLREYEDRDKTEQQKLTERAEAAERKAAEVELRALRLEVAAEKGLTASQAKRLIGSTRDELESDADEMLADLRPGRPAGDAGQGPRGEAPKGDMNSLIRRAAGVG